MLLAGCLMPAKEKIIFLSTHARDRICCYGGKIQGGALSERRNKGEMYRSILGRKLEAVFSLSSLFPLSSRQKDEDSHRPFPSPSPSPPRHPSIFPFDQCAYVLAIRENLRCRCSGRRYYIITL